MMGLEPTTFCMARAGGRSRPFAPVRRKLICAGTSLLVTERQRSRANAERSHCSHCDCCHIQELAVTPSFRPRLRHRLGALEKREQLVFRAVDDRVAVREQETVEVEVEQATVSVTQAFLSTAGAFLLAQGRPATVIQVTGGSARRAMQGRGLWAAGSFGVRALTNTAALELREHGIHVALLIVDAGIEPISGAPPGQPNETLADPHALAEAIRFLADQGARSATHELQITPLAERWIP
jgi:hypothetical protein